VIKPVATILLHHIKRTTFLGKGEMKGGFGSDMGQKKGEPI